MSCGYLVKSGAEILLNFYFINIITLLILELVFKVSEAFENADRPPWDLQMPLNSLSFYFGPVSKMSEKSAYLHP